MGYPFIVIAREAKQSPAALSLISHEIASSPRFSQ
jgi:hypothetical protein